MPQRDSVPASEEVLLVLSRICLIVAALSTYFVLFQTVPVMVTGGGWEEEVVRTIAYKTTGFIASVYVYLGSTELHPAASSPFFLHPQCSNGLFCLNADYCLCFCSICNSAEHLHLTSTQWLKFPIGAMLSSCHKLFLLAMKISDKLSDVLVWLASVFAFRIVLLISV